MDNLLTDLTDQWDEICSQPYRERPAQPAYIQLLQCLDQAATEALRYSWADSLFTYFKQTNLLIKFFLMGDSYNEGFRGGG